MVFIFLAFLTYKPFNHHFVLVFLSSALPNTLVFSLFHISPVNVLPVTNLLVGVAICTYQSLKCMS